MVWFLDTNIIVACLRGKSPAAMRRLQAVQASDVRVPLQVHAELLVGAAKSNNPNQAKARVLAFRAPFVVAWIAATVRTAGGTLVTNNTREFSRVQNLLLEDWTLP